MNSYTLVTIFCWGIFFAYWWLMSRKVKAAVYAQSKVSRYIYMFFIVFSFVLLYAPFFAIGPFAYQVIRVSRWSGISGAVICIAGVAFAIWARKTLGDNWSANVTLKKEHELIQSGPYRIVRHPIYTGFELCFLGAAITIGQLKGFIAVAIIFAAHLLKISMEEKLMHQQFGGQYREYAKRVKKLIPFVF